MFGDGTGLALHRLPTHGLVGRKCRPVSHEQKDDRVRRRCWSVSRRPLALPFGL